MRLLVISLLLATVAHAQAPSATQPAAAATTQPAEATATTKPAAPPPAPGSPEALLADIAAVALPKRDPRNRDEAARESWQKEYDAALQRKVELMGEFCRKFPDHEAAARTYTGRWEAQIGRLKQWQPVITETEAVMSNTQDAKLAGDALYWWALATSNASNWTAAQSLPAIERFATKYPADERGAHLLTALAAALPAAQTQQAADLVRRAIKAFPEAKNARQWAGRLKHLEAIGKPFELRFTDAISGKSIDMKDLRGKVVVIDFWATWCGPCVAEIPHLKGLYEKYRERGVEVIGISLDKSEAEGGLTKLKDFVAERGLPWLHYYQGNFWKGEFSSGWGINSIPTMFIVDAEGKLYSTTARGKLDTLIPELLALRDAAGGAKLADAAAPTTRPSGTP